MCANAHALYVNIGASVASGMRSSIKRKAGISVAITVTINIKAPVMRNIRPIPRPGPVPVIAPTLPASVRRFTGN